MTAVHRGGRVGEMGDGEGEKGVGREDKGGRREGERHPLYPQL